MKNQHERHAAPYAQHRPNVAEVMPLVNAFYAFPENGVGGSLHIVLDDGNVEDESVDYCIDFALGTSETRHEQSHAYPHDVKGELLGRLIRLMSQTQRRKLASAHNGYGRGHEITETEFIMRCSQLLSVYQASPAVAHSAPESVTDERERTDRALS